MCTTPTLPDQKTLKVFCDQPACWRPSKTSCETFCSIGGLNLHAERAKHINAPACARLPVLFVLGHGRGDFAVNQPVAAVDVVVVAAGTRPLRDESADMLDGRKAARRASFDVGRHLDSRRGGIARRRGIHCWTKGSSEGQSLGGSRAQEVPM